MMTTKIVINTTFLRTVICSNNVEVIVIQCTVIDVKSLVPDFKFGFYLILIN